MRRILLCLLLAALLVGMWAAPAAAASADTPALWASFWTWFDFTSNRTRVIQVGTIVMCFALFIMMRK
jgi:hypothetical protein